MADEQFDLGEALGSYEQAQADRNFYLSMVQGGTQMASPIAAYLAGVSGVKMANMRQKAQNIEDKRQAEKDAIAATERAQKHAETLRNNLFSIAQAANKGDIAQGSAAALYGQLVREMGATPVSYDADNGLLTYNYKGDDYEVDLKESPTSKLQQNYYKTQANLALQQARENRLAKEAESRIKLNQQKLDNLAKGKTGSGSTQAETKFLQENKDLFDNVWNPKSIMLKRKPLLERLQNYAGKDTTLLNKWIRGVETLPEDAQERLGEYTDLVAKRLEELSTQGPQLVSPSSESAKKSVKVF